MGEQLISFYGTEDELEYFEYKDISCIHSKICFALSYFEL